MIRSVRSALVLLTSRAYALVGLGSIAALSAIVVLLKVADAGTTIDEQGPMGDSLTIAGLSEPGGLGAAVSGTIALVGLTVLAVHATAAASDHATGVLRNLLVRQPSRWRLLAGRSVALAMWTVAATAVAVLVAVAATYAVAPEGVDTTAWTEPEGLRRLAAASLNLLLASLGWGLLGQVLAVVSRSAVVSLAIGAAVAIPLDVTISEAWPSGRPWLVGRVLEAVSLGGTADITYGRALVTLASAAVVAVAVAVWSFERRDVTC